MGFKKMGENATGGAGENENDTGNLFTVNKKNYWQLAKYANPFPETESVIKIHVPSVHLGKY